MSEPKRIQRKRTKGWRMPPNTVCVTRPGPFGNPFSTKDGLAAEDAVELYRLWAKGDIEEGDRLTMPNGNVVEVPEFPLSLDSLRDKDLACWCAEDAEWCHADVLLELANAAPEPQRP